MDKKDKKGLLIKFGDNLRKLRQEKGYSQQQLADELDVEVSQISRIERGVIDTSVTMLYRISNIIEVSISKFFE